MSKEKDRNFLIEIKNEVQEGMDKKDPERLKYAIRMLSDWIDELNEHEQKKA